MFYYICARCYHITKQKIETNDSNVEQMPQDEISIEKNEIISKIEELLNYLTSNETNQQRTIQNDDDEDDDSDLEDEHVYENTYLD